MTYDEAGVHYIPEITRISEKQAVLIGCRMHLIAGIRLLALVVVKCPKEAVTRQESKFLSRHNFEKCQEILT